jgi:NTE family protein
MTALLGTAAAVGKKYKGKTVGIALGAGSARGIAHIGVLQALREMGVEPSVVCGCSMGALVGASYVTGHLDDLAEWASKLTTRSILHYVSFRLMAQGGVAEANALIEYLSSTFGDPAIESLDASFVAVATDLYRGREVWLQDGSLWDAVRASIAIPGMLTPVSWRERWLVDGALVNPVPVSVCHALGADIVIAVNPSGLMVRRGPAPRNASEEAEAEALDLVAPESPTSVFGRMGNLWQEARQLVSNKFSGGRLSDNESIDGTSVETSKSLVNKKSDKKLGAPGALEAMQGAIMVMQDRITRSRLAGEPPDVMLLPRVNHIGLLEYHRGIEAIAAGRECVERAQEAIQHALDS